MRFKTCVILLLYVFFVTSVVNAKFGFGRSSSHGSRSSGRSRTSSGSSSSHGTSTGHSKPSTTSHGSTRFGSSTGGRYPSHSTGHSSGQTSHQQNKQSSATFLNAEGGGATRPAQVKPPTSFGNPYPPASTGHLPNTGRMHGTVTESKQTSGFPPSAPPKDHMMKSNTNTLQNQGGNNAPYNPATGPTHPPWSNPYLGANQPAATSQTHPPWSNPHIGTTNPGSQPPPIGFKDHVYPQSRPTYPNPPNVGGHPPYPHSAPPNIGGHAPYPHSAPPNIGGHAPYPHSAPPNIGGHAPYPHSAPPNSPWLAPPHSYPSYQTHSMPMGNPYSMHPPGNAYGTPGQAYYPQQTHVLAQPATQPFVPGQTVIMVPGKQDSGPGFGQLVKEALVFSTINAGVNRIINPHTHTHYVESRPESQTPTTHITYNNQYFNTVPGANGTTNPGNVPQGSVPGNYPTGVPYSNPGSTPSAGTGNIYTPSNPPINGVASPTNGVVGGVASGTPTTGTPTSGTTVTTTNSNIPNNQQNPSSNDNIANRPLNYGISDDDLYKITEQLFSRNSFNVSKYIKMNLQTRVNVTSSTNITDEAKQQLFDVEPELLDYPSVYVTRSLYHHYEHDSRKKFNRTLETREQENLLIDTFLNTNVMATTMQWLADRGFIDPDDFERKDVLRRIWFTMFSGSTCGFERVFASENYGTAVVGVQDWIYFENQEMLKRINYMSYVDKLDLGSTASLLKLNYEIDGVVRPNATIFVGTLPELEMSLYTICFYARPNNVCPVSLGGAKFNIYTHTFTYFGNDVIDLGLPFF